MAGVKKRLWQEVLEPWELEQGFQTYSTRHFPVALMDRLVLYARTLRVTVEAALVLVIKEGLLQLELREYTKNYGKEKTDNE